MLFENIYDCYKEVALLGKVEHQKFGKFEHQTFDHSSSVVSKAHWHASNTHFLYTQTTHAIANI